MKECKCEEHAKKISELERKVEGLESFVQWARPILEMIKSLKTESKYMMITFLAFISIVVYVYQYQIQPYFDKQNSYMLENTKKQGEDKIDIIREIQKSRIETNEKIQGLNNKFLEELITTEKKINRHSTDASKMNYSGITKVIRKEVRNIGD